MGAPPQVRRKQLTPEQTPPPPGTPPAPPGDNHGAQSSQIANLPARYVYIPTILPSAQLFNQDASTKDSEHDEDFIPDLRTHEGTSTGQYTICCMLIELTSIVQMTPAD